MEATQFLRNLLQALTYRVRTVLTDTGIQVTNRAQDAHAFAHIFGRARPTNGIEHHFIKVENPWTNVQVDRVNRTVKDANVKRFHDGEHGQFHQYLTDFIDAYNIALSINLLSMLIPYKFICKPQT
jgi:transposase InsO family protein